MLKRKHLADLALVLAIFVATAGLVEAQKLSHTYLDPSLINFQLRSQTLKTRITDGLFEGKLRVADGHRFLFELQSINDALKTTKASDGQINARLNAQLDKLAIKVDLKMADRTVKSKTIADIVAKKSSIEAQLSSAQLLPIQKALFENKLKRISAFESYLLSNGGLNYWQRRKICADLDLLASQLAARKSQISLLP